MNDFEDVKGKIRIAEFIRDRTGRELKKVGSSLDLAECPFCGGHDCFRIDENKQAFKCFQCDRGGDVFTFLEETGLDKAGALREAAEYAGVELKAGYKPAETSTRQKVLQAAVAYFQKNLWENGASSYLRDKRGRAQATLEAMKVGFSDGKLNKYLLDAGFTQEDTLASGLVKEKDGRVYDFFKAGLYIYPHLYGGKVLHFTQKDPEKKAEHQLPNKHRDEKWRFYNQDALSKYGEVIVVEGENDLQAWYDLGFRNVIGVIGQVSQEQVVALGNFCKGKHLYLCFDNDKAGRAYTRKVVSGLSDPEYHIRVVVFDPAPKEQGGAGDIDEYFRDRVKDGKQTEAKRLFGAAISPIAWEILQVKGLGSLEEKLKALKESRVFEAMSDLVEVEKEAYVEQLIDLGFSKRAVEQQLEQGHALLDRVKQHLGKDKKDIDPNIVAGVIFKGFSERGRWFYDREYTCYLFYQHKIYRIGSNRPFNALMKRHTTLLPTKEPGRSVWESIASECYNCGTQVQVLSWLHTERKTDTIYVNFNSDKNTILKISPKAIEEIPNGTNADEVLLNPSKRIMPFNYLPDCKVSEGMGLLKSLIFDNLSCEREQKYLILTWFMSCFLYDFAPYAALVKFSGHTASGKTTAAKFLSLLLYGDQHLSDPTSSAAYTIAAGNPLLVVDNLESDDVTKSMLKFLLLSATKGSKEKRAGGTDAETVEESPKALILITAIEPFPKPELINRTYDIEFDRKYWSEDFFEDDVLNGILKNRDLIISSIFKILAFKVLPNLEKRRDYNTILKKEYRGHSKERTNEFLSLLMLLLDKVIDHLPYYDEDEMELLEDSGAREIRKAWITYQDSRAKETESETNPMLTMLNALWREYKPLMGSPGEKDETWQEGGNIYTLKNQEYGIEMEMPLDKSFVEFEASSHDLFIVFSKLGRNIGIKSPYSNARQLGVRLSNDEGALKEGGWTVLRKPELGYWRIVHGDRKIRFHKTLKDG